MTNPLLEEYRLPPFSRIRADHVAPAIEEVLAENRATIERLLSENTTYTWDNLVAPIEARDDRLSRLWSPVRHLNAVMNDEQLREAYNEGLARISEYATEIGQHEGLYNAFKSIAEGNAAAHLSPEQRKVLDDALRDFRLSGVHLPPEKKARFKEIQQRLSRLQSQFEENVLDATFAWEKHVTDQAELAGLPDSALGLARQQAEQRGKDGWVFTLEIPSFLPVVTYADNRALRRELYEAFTTRASDQGPNAGTYDNSPVMQEILALRHEAAQLLGFNHYSELSLEKKMARTPDEVLGFLHDLAERATPRARQEFDELREFAWAEYGHESLEAWDVPYFAEKLRQQRYQLSQEELRPWFPVHRVIQGLFQVVERLFDVRIQEATQGIDAWHPDVTFYEIRDPDGTPRAGFYLDLYARPGKRGGAWMDVCVSRRRTGDEIQRPVAYMTCNFTPPVGDDPSLLTHDEVVTLFHEFGHGLHHMLTQVDYTAISGISGVPWDAVELPSQFMENWCWTKEAMPLISGHWETGEPLPQALFDRLTAARNFQSAMQMVRQLEFSLFDFRLHTEYDPASPPDILGLLNAVRDQVAVVKPPAFNRFPNSFNHVFGGAYAAGYYSYKWAEVLSADAFSLFEERGIFDTDTGRRFREAVLERGGSREPLELFVEFRGREPQIDALLRHTGIAA